MSEKARQRRCPYLFAYGTLRRGARKDLLDFVAARLVGRATVSGRLYDLGDYPGMLDPVEAEERVVGDLFELENVGSTLNELDEYEGPEEFERRLTLARLEDGGELDAWVYVYQGSVGDARRISSGDYFRQKD